MIPILFSAATANNTNGLGRLTDCVSCVVEENRNGSYTLEMQYPVTGIHYDDINLWYQIRTTAFKGSGSQIFRIYKITKPLNGIVTIYAEHISYDLKRIVVSPFTATSVGNALTLLKNNMQESNDFTFWTNKTTVGNFSMSHPDMARNILGGQSGSILDTYGAGDYEFDNYSVKLWLHRGSDRGVTIRYGKNLTDIEANTDNSSTFASIVPYWVSQDGNTTVVGNKVTSGHESDIPTFPAKVMDFTQSFEDTPTAAQLEAKATEYLTNNAPWEIKQNLTVSFVALADTEEYKNIASLETVNLCDTVHVYHPGLGVTASAKVIRTKWDSLRERYIEIELGSPKTSLYQAINPITQTDLTEQAEQTSNFLLDSMAALIDALAGVDKGHIVFKRTADGHISEIYAMDNDDQSEATNVLRINYLGIYASTSGINGTYNLAITTGGTINASQILTGILTAIEINNGSGTFHVSNAGVVTATAGTIGGWSLNSGYLYKDVTSGGVDYRFWLQPPSGYDNSWMISAQKYNTNDQTWEGLWYITADGSMFMNEILSPIMVDGKLTCAADFEVMGNAVFDTTSEFNNTAYYKTAPVYNVGMYVGGSIYLGTYASNGVTPHAWLYANSATSLMFYMSDNTSRSMALSQESGHWGLHPTMDTYLDLGLSGHRWDNVYAQVGTIQTSDKNAKKGIKSLPKKALEFIKELRPVSFLLKKGTSGRRHWGFIAQEVEETMEKTGFSDMDFAGLVKDEEGRYGLRYEEFIAPLTLAVQDLIKRVEKLEGK